MQGVAHLRSVDQRADVLEAAVGQDYAPRDVVVEGIVARGDGVRVQAAFAASRCEQGGHGDQLMAH
ncbi:MAG: hypothetical protein OXJ37_04730 [Bryobacterales bacterium]|nr:hypothetical protein [Bryobacterales bacterium]